MSTYRLDHFFAPRSIALIGGSPKPASVGGTTLRNLLSGGFRRPIHIVNRKYPEIEGIKTLRDIEDIPEIPDLTIISTPPSAIPGIVKRAGARNFPAAMVLSAGLGLGTGSTARHFVDLLGDRVRAGLDVVGIPTSEATAADARHAGIPLTTLDHTPRLDLTVDGADEIGPGLALIKGGGGALLREKIVAAASAHMIVVADESKLVPALGAFPLPIEVVPFGMAATEMAIGHVLEWLSLPSSLRLRMGADGHAFVTDGGHRIIDAALGRIPDPEALAAALTAIPGVVEHGLFLGLAGTAIVAGASGIRVIERQNG